MFGRTTSVPATPVPQARSARRSRRARRPLLLTSAVAAGTVAAGLVTAITPAIASAAPVCPGAGQAPRVVGSVPGAALEGLTVDAGGRLYTTDLISGRVFRLSAPGAPAVPIARVPDGGAGALAWARDGALLVGYGLVFWLSRTMNELRWILFAAGTWITGDGSDAITFADTACAQRA